jgi:putative CocE/NonD family hydrolase
MFGGSYMGYTQYAAASTRPPALKTITPAIAFTDPVTTTYQGGAVQLGLAVNWGLLAWAQMAIMRQPVSEAEKAPLYMQWIATVDGMARGDTFQIQPPVDIPLIGRNGLIPIFAETLANPQGSEYWKQIACAYDQIDIPVFHIGGWYDVFISQTFQHYSSLLQTGNRQQKVLIGPWTHGSFDNSVGDADFGLQSSGLLVLPEEILLRWFDYWLKGVENGVMQEPPVQIFVMGDNYWRPEMEWPLARTQYAPYYFHSQGAANTLDGDGTLSLASPEDEPVDSFVYDPRNPVPTRGGGLCCWSAALPPGAYDQREIEKRPDVLVYSSAPLEKDLEVTGPIEVRLWAASSAVDTDFTAKLVDVGPRGYARNLTDGILRARYRQPGQETLLKPGEPYEFRIQLAPTSNVFKAGHRVRVEISSSNFPRFDRNPNTGQIPLEATDLRPALQTILHDGAHPSCIVLPVIPR